jgi:predicted  nucleic acid-binding Zn-ribbon protein
MNLKDEIQKLVHLQEVDSRIYALDSRKNNDIPQQLEQLKTDFEIRKKEFEIFSEKIKQLQVKRKEKELDLTTKEESIKKSQNQLFQLKTNREYQAKLTEIASLQADASILEEDVIKILEQIEGVDAQMKEAKVKLTEQEKVFKEQEVKLSSQMKEIEVEVSELQARRNLLIKDIDRATLSKYEKLIKTRSGLALSAIDVENENCGACHMRVTAQKINEIKMYDQLVFCESCVRILYIPEDFRL